MNLHKLVFFSILIIACQYKKNTIETPTELKPYKTTIQPEFKPHFDACGVEGSIAIFNEQNKEWILSDTLGVRFPTLPASTFKIINLLIALETKVIANEHEIVAWPGDTDTVKYGYRPEIYHDMSVKEAFEVSAGWVFIELAKRIGKERYEHYLHLSEYGNQDLTQSDADFWNFGAFAISPINQVEFLRKLYAGKLPFSPENMAIVKKVMVTEFTDAYTIRSKTGWTRENNINTGWWVGYIEKGNGVYFFATRLLQDRNQNREDFGACRKSITRSIFKDLKVLD